MAIIIDLPNSLESGRAASAVRSGSSLSPERRYTQEREGYKKEWQNKLFHDGESKKTAALAKDNGRSRTNKEACIGMPMHSDTFIKRLIQLNSSLWFEVANADSAKMGIYLICPVSMTYPEGKQFLFGFHTGVMPEFTLQRNPGEDGENIGILRQGYRTILARLIRLRMISLDKVEVMFGPPSHDSAYWACLVGKRSTIN